jgi:hypothetical protein
MSDRVVINKRGYPVAGNGWGDKALAVPGSGGRRRYPRFLRVRHLTAGGIEVRDTSGRSRHSAGGY